MDDETQEILNKITEIITNWEARAKDYGDNHFFFGEKFMFNNPDQQDGRLLKAYNTGRKDPALETLTSMRNVDSTVKSNIIFFDSGDR